jgi:hypothetical protein
VEAASEAGLLAALAAAEPRKGVGWWDALEVADEVNAEHGARIVLAVPLEAGGFGVAVPLGCPRVALPVASARAWVAAWMAPAGEGHPAPSPAGQQGEPR